jgi:hypothetical protein
MAVPLVQPWLRGTDGGWTHFTMCCWSANDAGRQTVSGLLGTRAATVVPSVGTGFSVVNASAKSELLSIGAGGAYRLIRVRSGVSREADDAAQPDTTAYLWSVSSDVFAYDCTQRGTSRDPLRDCSTGTQTYTRGQVRTPHADWSSAFTVAIPITYGNRSVDVRGRPLTTPRTASGHWTLSGTPSYHGWLWTTEWNVSGVGSGRVAGSAFIRADKEIVLTDGPFN